jgi:hypothetical protein
VLNRPCGVCVPRVCKASVSIMAVDMTQRTCSAADFFCCLRPTMKHGGGVHWAGRYGML